jgi:hypothetical protein
MTKGLSILLVISPVIAFTQGSDIRGVVADAATGERIPAASVLVREVGRGASTNESGFYLIPNVPGGTREIIASAVGYEPGSRRVLVAGGFVTVNFALKQKPVESPEVVIEGTRDAATETGTSVRVLDRREILRVPAAAAPDLFRTLQLLPGIASTSDVSSKFYVRGGAGDQNLILLDGMKIYNPFHAFGLFSIFDPDLVRTADVYTGGFPAGYGGRLSSVVDVRTKDGNASRLSGIAGVNFLSAKAQLEGPIEDQNSWLVSGRVSMFDRTLRRMLTNSQPVSFYDLFFKGTIGTPTGKGVLRGFLSGDDAKPDDPLQPNHTWRNQSYAFSLSTLVTDRMYLDILATYGRYRVSRDVKSSTVVFPAESRLSEIGLRTELTFYSESEQSLAVGLELTFPQFENRYTTATNVERFFPDSDVEVWGWVRYRTTVGPLAIDAGIHADIPALSGDGTLVSIFQPRASIACDLGGGWRAKASYGVFTQNIVAFSNEDDVIAQYEAWVFLPRSLRPEVAHHAIAGVEGNLLPSISTDVQLYAKSYHSLVLYNREKIFPEDPDYVRGTGESNGGEALVRFASTTMDLYAAYSLGWVTVHSGGTSYGPRYDRRHAVKALGTLRPWENVEIAVRWEYGSGSPYTQNAGFYDRLTLDGIADDSFPGGSGSPVRVLGPKNAARLPSYHRMDAGVTYRFTVGNVRGTTGMSLMNVFDTKNILYYDRKTGNTDYMIGFFPSASLTLEF